MIKLRELKAFLTQKRIPEGTIVNRYILGKKQIKENGDLRSPNDFMHPKGESSIYQTHAFNKGQHLSIATEHILIGKRKGRTLAGYAPLSVDDLREISWPEEAPHASLDAKTYTYPHRLHGNILHCPMEHERALQLAVAEKIRDLVRGKCVKLF